MTFAHLHNHTEYSALDGLTLASEAAERAAADGNTAVAITDHGTCAGHPAFQRACDAAGVKPIFGIETYFVDDRLPRPATGDKAAQAALRANEHLVLLAMDDQGLQDLWALSTEAYRTGHYHRPRCDWDLLERYGSHLVATSSCLGGVLSKDLLAGRTENAVSRALRFKSLFEGRFFLEVQGNALPEQRRLNQMLMMMNETFGIPLVAASDAHYPGPDQAELHRLWMRCQSGQPDDYWNYVHMQTRSEAIRALGYLEDGCDQAIANAGIIADMCNARIRPNAEHPVFTGSHREDASRLLDLCMENWSRIRVPGDRQEYFDRTEREWHLVASKDLAGCYLIVHDIIRYAKSKGVIVGPGRGSAAGSLMSYLLGITSIDPLRTGLMFERFLTPGRTSLPDFDLDFPTSARPLVQDYASMKYGDARVVRVGTHMRYRSKGILNKLFSVILPFEQENPPRIASIIDEAESHTAGLGLSWDELMNETGDQLEPYIQHFGEVFARAAELQGRLSGYGTHPAGLVISTSQDLANLLPMRRGENAKDHMISQFDFRDMEALGHLKLDILTLRTLDTISETIRLVEKRTGVRLDPPEWEDEHGDPQVWEEIGTGNTMGMFQIETTLGRDLCRRMKPATVPDLAAIVALVRPGPRNSGMTESYLRRRAGREEVTYPHPLLEKQLGDQFGIMVYQEDILQACRLLAGYDDAEADKVRSVLGKKKIDQIEETGHKFMRRAVEQGLKYEEADTLWASMAEFGRYAFNLAHAYSYATLSYWTAWLKAHYPVETLTAILSTLKDKDRMPLFATEARRLGITILPPDVRISRAGFQCEGIAIRYGLSSIKGLGPAAITGIIAGQPYEDLAAFMEGSKADSGVVYALAKAGALDPLVPTRRALVASLEADRSGESTRCTWKAQENQPWPRYEEPELEAMDPEERQWLAPDYCQFDWKDAPQPEPVIGKSGKPLKVKLITPPKLCTRACRNYSPPSLNFGTSREYSPAALWALEEDTYGTWMTPAAFEQLDRISPGLRSESRDVALMLPYAPRGAYPIAAVHAGLRTAYTRNGNMMWWQKIATEVSIIDVAVFSPRRDDEPDVPSAVRGIPRGTLVIATVIKDAYRTPAGQWRTSWRLADLTKL
jgi:DNA polymerase-3 subunit alpha